MPPREERNGRDATNYDALLLQQGGELFRTDISISQKLSKNPFPRTSCRGIVNGFLL